jgi:integrase
MRRGEILAMKRSWLDFARGCINIPGESTKNGKPRSVPINQVVQKALSGLQSAMAKVEEPIFKNPKTGAVLGDVKKGFAAACEAANLDDFRFHDLRHTFGTRLADTGADPFVIAEIMGHSDLRMTKRYCHATDHRKRGAVERIADYSGAENCLKIVTTEGRRAG